MILTQNQYSLDPVTLFKAQAVTFSFSKDLFRKAMKYVYFLLFAVLTLVSCSSDEIAPEGTNTNIPQGTAGYRFSVNVGEPTTRVTYHDNIGAENSPFNPNSDGSNKLTMSWRHGDELVAIRWKAPYNEYVVLQAEVAEGQDGGHEINFDAEDVAHFKTPLEEGERFVLVHGDFVLDASHKTNGEVDPVIDFPTSQVTKEGYASHIHHGGVEEGKDLTFRNQDGTLENLRKHEYMVADCYVHANGKDANGNVQVSLSGSKTVADQDVTMHIAHTLLRLTLFLPDEDFNNGDEDDLISVSLKDAKAAAIFHRYFRMHPNEAGTTNYYKTSYNDNADHEENAYIRINLADETTNKHGVSHRDINVFGSDGFNPEKPVSVKGTVGGKEGHYFTLYFSLPSRHMGVEGEDPSELRVTAFTRTHAYTTTKTYRLPDDAMQPGKVVPLNVSFVDNATKIKAITDPELGFSFTPGFVYANKNSNGTWTYGVYQCQGQYAGMSHQTLDFGEYFTFGSVDPTQAAHRAGGVSYDVVVPEDFTDVASKVKVGDADGLYHMITKAEADRIMARLKEEVGKNGVFLGYYYYDAGDLSNTAHKAPGSQQASILSAAAAGGAKTVDELMAMSASVGIYVGRSTQPKFEEQDDYFFLPSAAQMHYSTSGTGINLIETGWPKSNIWYYLPPEYKHLEATGDALTKPFTDTFKFSTWLRDASNTGYRMQAWTTNAGKALDTGRTNADISDVKKYARPIRAVIY